jgi:hypothetical protein
MTRANNELNAMQAVADALSSLEDGDSRQRVLRWASEHFGTELVPSVLAAASQAPAPASLRQACDPENLDSLFGDAEPEDAVRPVGRAEKGSVLSSVHSFVADFQQLANDWQKA